MIVAEEGIDEVEAAFTDVGASLTKLPADNDQDIHELTLSGFTCFGKVRDLAFRKPSYVIG